MSDMDIGKFIYQSPSTKRYQTSIV
jgi:hypothetical protein